MPIEQIERHPFAKVPAFEHNGFKLYEVCAIGRYVDEEFDGPSLQPEDVRDRARMTQIISILDNYTYPCTVGDLVIQRLVMPMLGNQPDEAAIAEVLPIDGKRRLVAKHDVIFIPPGVSHAMYNTGLGDLTFIVVTTPTEDI